jgi:hypothetical protein
MGLALRGDRLAIGTTMQVWESRDVPAVTAKLGPRRAACFLPRRCHITGNVQVHEMAWATTSGSSTPGSPASAPSTRRTASCRAGGPPWSLRWNRGGGAVAVRGRRSGSHRRAGLVLPGKRYPELINDDARLVESSFVLPDEALRDVPDLSQARTGPG